MKLLARCLVCLAVLSASVFLIVDGILRIFVFDYIGIKMHIDGIVLLVFGLLLLVKGKMLLSILILDFKLINKIGYDGFLETVKGSPIHVIFPFFIKKK